MCYVLIAKEKNVGFKVFYMWLELNLETRWGGERRWWALVKLIDI